MGEEGGGPKGVRRGGEIEGTKQVEYGQVREGNASQGEETNIHTGHARPRCPEFSRHLSSTLLTLFGPWSDQGSSPAGAGSAGSEAKAQGWTPAGCLPGRETEASSVPVGTQSVGDW